MKNALLLFLSEIHIQKETKKLSITEYSTEEYGKIQCCQTNEASVKYLMKKLTGNTEEIDKIFAFSTKLTKEKVEYRDEQGNAVVKNMQRDIFEENIIREFPQLAGCIEYIDFDEDCDSKKIIQYVLKMVDAMSVAMGDEVAEWIVHTDLTGGMRHAAVLMMSVLHLLKYRGINIGDAIYANYYREDPSKNRIEDVSNIHRMFELVSSTDSFLNYATLREIENYFAKVPTEEKSDKLQRLLTALRDFSDAVKVCRTGKFESSLRELADSLDKFKQYSEKSTQEALFAQVLGALEKDYQGIISKDISRTDIIRWCIRKEYLQQAMTLFNEWMQRLIVDFKIYYPNPQYVDLIKKKCEENNAGYKNIKNVFIDNFYINRGKLVFDISSFRKMMEKKGDGTYPDNEFKEIVKKLIEECKNIDIFKEKILSKRLSWDDFKNEHPLIFKCIENKRWAQHKQDVPNEEYFLSKQVKAGNMFTHISSAKSDFIYDLFGIDSVSDALNKTKHIAEKNSEENIAEKWEKRWLQINEMLNDEVVLSISDKDKVKSILQGMHWIREQRNQINHANSSAEVATNEQLKGRMIDIMDLIESVKTE